MASNILLQLAAGSNTGRLWSYGANSNGTAGVGILGGPFTFSPVQIASSVSSAFSIPVGTFYIRTDNSLWYTGYGFNGCAGIPSIDISQTSTNYASVPIQVGALLNWNTLANGFYYSIARKTDGTIWSWGDNTYGSLGLNDTVNRLSPVQIGALTGWTAVGAGGQASFAIRGGALWSWGDNADGQLGLGDVVLRSSPVQIGALTTWSAVVGTTETALGGFGGLSAYGITTGGALWAWGGNLSGQLGIGNTLSRSSPVQVGALTNWTSKIVCIGQIVGSQIVYAIKSDGTLWTWGGSVYSSPVQIGSDTNWSNVFQGSAQSFTVLLVKTTGTIWGIGEQIYGNWQNGNKNQQSLFSPIQIGSSTDNALTGSASGYTSLYLKTNNTLLGNGTNEYLALGQGFTYFNVYPRSKPVQLNTGWSDVVGGGFCFLFLKRNGTMWSVGLNSNGELGVNDTNSRSSPVQIGALTNWTNIAATNTTCYALASNNLYSWGNNIRGQLANGFSAGADNRSSPVQITGTWSSLATTNMSAQHMLAIRSTGTLWGWGSNGSGQLGQNNTSFAAVSPLQVGALTNWSSVVLGTNETFAFDSSGQLWGWGLNNNGQLGINNIISRSSPVQIGTVNEYRIISSGNNTTFAIKQNGTLWSWGNNLYGQLGHSNVIFRSSPVQVGSLNTWVNVKVCSSEYSTSSGQVSVLILRNDNTLWQCGVSNDAPSSNSTVFTVYPTTDPASFRSSPVQISSGSVKKFDATGATSFWFRETNFII
jgi:alpha-tubulin suppressor-like RCC1 family protein